MPKFVKLRSGLKQVVIPSHHGYELYQELEMIGVREGIDRAEGWIYRALDQLEKAKACEDVSTALTHASAAKESLTRAIDEIDQMLTTYW